MEILNELYYGEILFTNWTEIVSAKLQVNYGLNTAD